MKHTAEELYSKLVNDYEIVGKTGGINFTVKDLSIVIHAKDSVGNLLQEWLKAWFQQNKIDFEENTNSQSFPDFLLDKDDYTRGLLEVKSFDLKNGPGFDLANFDSYCNSLLDNAYRLDSNYLILGYTMKEGIITIENVWLKKIWEISRPSRKWPINVQAKKEVIYNLRPAIWYSKSSKFETFKTKQQFLNALNETRYQYPQTRHGNAHWLNNVIKNYEHHTGTKLKV